MKTVVTAASVDKMVAEIYENGKKAANLVYEERVAANVKAMRDKDDALEALLNRVVSEPYASTRSTMVSYYKRLRAAQISPHVSSRSMVECEIEIKRMDAVEAAREWAAKEEAAKEEAAKKTL